MIVDLFAGPGGWDESTDLEPLGIELDAAACATRAAAGHKTEQADVSALDPHAFGRVEGLIGSPPCQTFSAAGDREGVSHLGALVRFIDSLETGWRDPVDPGWDRVKTGLVLEPLRWAHALVPEWIALEQVPPVLPVWEATARTLRAWGWSVWTGCLSAETFGVPQTRNRAILMAHRRKVAQPPAPTHQEYVPGVPAREQAGLFGTLKPWVSMAEALGWGMTERPYPTVIGGHSEPTFLHHQSRETVRAEREAGRWLNTGRDWKPGGTRADAQKVPDTAPAPALTAKAGGQWAWERPATTIVGSFAPDTLAPPTWRGPGDGPRQSQPGAIKLTLRDGLVLQSFRPDYPVQGSKTKQWEQVGNAIPPLMAGAILGALL